MHTNKEKRPWNTNPKVHNPQDHRKRNKNKNKKWSPSVYTYDPKPLAKLSPVLSSIQRRKHPLHLLNKRFPPRPNNLIPIRLNAIQLQNDVLQHRL